MEHNIKLTLFGILLNASAPIFSTPAASLAAHLAEKNFSHSAIVRVDIQNDFLKGGALGLPRADEWYVKSVCNLLHIMKRSVGTVHIIDSEDAHTPDHISFAETHGVAPYRRIVLSNSRQQDVWPRHCVKGTLGAQRVTCAIEPNLIVQKGTESDADSYSAAYEGSPVHTYLKDHAVNITFVAGLALDYCVRATIEDLLKQPTAQSGEHVVILLDTATRAVDEAKGIEAIVTLQKQGLRVWHIRGLGGLTPEQEIAREEALRAAGVQLELFDATADVAQLSSDSASTHDQRETIVVGSAQS